MITEIEARRLNLPGCDTFKATELAYKDDINRDAFVIKLNIESYKIFCSSFLIGDYPNIIKEREQQIENCRKLNENNPETNNLTIFLPPIIQHRFEYINLEHFYLTTGFELSFKSKLLHRSFVVNIFEETTQFETLRKEQKKLLKNVQNIPQQPPMPPIQRTLIDDQRKFEGWRTEGQIIS